MRKSYFQVLPCHFPKIFGCYQESTFLFSPVCFIFTLHIQIHNLPLEEVGLHARILPCAVDSAVKGIETILSEIALSVPRP